MYSRIKLDVEKAFRRSLTLEERQYIGLLVEDAFARLRSAGKSALLSVSITRPPIVPERAPVSFDRQYVITNPAQPLSAKLAKEKFLELAPFLRAADSPATRLKLSRDFDARLAGLLGQGDAVTLPTIKCFYEVVSDTARHDGLVAATMSMRAAGHPVTVWSYSPSKLDFLLPHGVEVRPAEDIVPRDLFERIVAGSGIRYFSDIFRYALLYERGGLWMDSDVVLLRPFSYCGDYFLNLQWRGNNVGHFICNNVMCARPHSRHLRTLYEASVDRFFQSARREFGDIGPKLLSEYVMSEAGAELKQWIFSPVLFNSIDWTEVDKFDQPLSALADYLNDERVFGVHLWNSRTSVRAQRGRVADGVALEFARRAPGLDEPHRLVQQRREPHHRRSPQIELKSRTFP